ncbi:MAG: hypothetical protein U0W24_25650 [Bacteroidales bacterium]
MKTKPGKKLSLVVQTLFIIVFIAVSSILVMKMIDRDSDSLTVFFIGFAICVVAIIIIAIYINYLSNLYSQIKKAGKEHNIVELTTIQSEKEHMKTIHFHQIKKEKNSE